MASNDFTIQLLDYIEKFQNKIKIHVNFESPTLDEYLNVFAELPPPFERSEKSDIMAEFYRSQGNKAFAAGENECAAMLYTNSILQSPPYSTCAALAYANRSAAFYRLKLYKECVADVDRALDLPYPDELKHKVISRKNLALRNIREDSYASNGGEILRNQELKFAKGENAKLPGVSGGIAISCDAKTGARSLVAEVPFQPGEILVIDKPFLPVPVFDFEPAFCHNCLKKTLCLIPCERCNQRLWCSEYCRRDAFDRYHRIECVIIDALSFLKSGNRNESMACLLMCINVFTKQGKDLENFYKDFENFDKQSDPAERGSTEELFIPDTKKAFLSLPVTELKEKRNALLFDVAFLVILLRNCTDFFEKNSDVYRLAKIFVKVNMIYNSNNFPIRYLVPKKPKALAIFPLTGLINHACTNNTVAYVDNYDRLVLRASQNIKQGDKIHYNYHNLVFVFEGQMRRPGRSERCKRVCGKCDEVLIYPSERRPNVKIDKKLSFKLMKNPYDIDSLWKLLNRMQKENQRYTYQLHMLKIGIVNAYEESEDESKGRMRLVMMGIF